MQSKPRAILIAGPTSSGKSGLAVALAEAANGTVINADALQVYRELEILTARPGDEARARAPHALYGHVPARETYSVGSWLAHARIALAAAERAGRLPILVGGTGLYFRAALKGLADVPAIPSAVRDEARALHEAEGPERFRTRLASLDPEAAARLPLKDRARALRAYEVALATGRSLTEWQRGAHRPLLLEDETVRLVLMPDRERLQAAIAARFGAMLAAGALEEARAVLALSLPATMPAMKALGLSELGQHLSGKLELSAATEAAIQRTSRYAKRQLTWIRGQMLSWTQVNQQELNELTILSGTKLLKLIDPKGALR
jgi:tRNA dimethylallyltransferase